VTRVEEQLPASLRLAAPESGAVSVEDVARRVRRRRRIRWALAAGSAATLTAVAALVAPGLSTPSRRIDQPTLTPPVDLWRAGAVAVAEESVVLAPEPGHLRSDRIGWQPGRFCIERVDLVR
jgi:hypothetical protein